MALICYFKRIPFEMKKIRTKPQARCRVFTCGDLDPPTPKY